MNMIGFDVYTGKAMPVGLVVVRGDVGWISLIFVDNVSGLGVWQQTGDDAWYFDFGVDGDCELCRDFDAERITGVCGAVCGLDWGASANDFLADCGFKLGRFDVGKGDGYELVDFGEEC